PWIATSVNNGRVAGLAKFRAVLEFNGLVLSRIFAWLRDSHDRVSIPGTGHSVGAEIVFHSVSLVSSDFTSRIGVLDGFFSYRLGHCRKTVGQWSKLAFAARPFFLLATL